LPKVCHSKTELFCSHILSHPLCVDCVFDCSRFVVIPCCKVDVSVHYIAQTRLHSQVSFDEFIDAITYSTNQLGESTSAFNKFIRIVQMTHVAHNKTDVSSACVCMYVCVCVCVRVFVVIVSACVPMYVCSLFSCMYMYTLVHVFSLLSLTHTHDTSHINSYSLAQPTRHQELAYLDRYKCWPPPFVMVCMTIIEVGVRERAPLCICMCVCIYVCVCVYVCVPKQTYKAPIE